MANVNVLSVGITDATGSPTNRKTLPLFVPTTLSIANIQTLADALLPDLDEVIDGKISDLHVTLSLPVVSGLKGAAIVGQDVHNGARLSFDAAASTYAYGVYIPSWKALGFTGDSVNNADEYATFIADFMSLSLTDGNANALTDYLRGFKARRK